jgi:hypothetical protein
VRVGDLFIGNQTVWLGVYIAPAYAKRSSAGDEMAVSGRQTQRYDRTARPALAPPRGLAASSDLFRLFFGDFAAQLSETPRFAAAWRMSSEK